MRPPVRTAVRTALGLAAAAVLLTLSACGGGGGDASGDDTSASSSDSPSAAGGSAGAEADLSGIPDVVAEVNGEEVTKEEFAPIYQAQLQQATVQSQTSGEAPDEDALKKQTVDDLVDTELLSQEADARGIAVDEAAVDTELEKVAEQNQLGSVEELLAALDEQGVTEEQARAQIETQVMVEQLVADEDGPIDPTEKELRTLYAQVKKQAAQSGQAAQKIPPFAEVRSQLEQEARAQQIGTVAGALVEDLRKDADITINL